MFDDRIIPNLLNSRLSCFQIVFINFNFFLVHFFNMCVYYFIEIYAYHMQLCTVTRPFSLR